MNTSTPPAGIPPEDWDQTPASVRLLLLTLLERVRDLEARLNQHSLNSSKPPASDPPSAPPRPPKKETGRPAGAQLGHQGTNRELLPPEQVTEIVAVYPTHCPACSCALSDKLPDAAPLLRSQVWDIPPITPHITEYQHHTVCCPCCEQFVRCEQRPDGAPPGGYGARATALVALLRGEYHLSERAAQALLASVWSFPLSLGSISRCCERLSDALEAVYTDVQHVAHVQAVANVDETSWREAGKRTWLWVLVTRVATLFVVAGSRGRGTLAMLLGTTFNGIVGSDRYQAYNSLPDQRRQRCWSHLLRNFQALSDYHHPDSGWADDVLALTQQVFTHWHAFRDGQLDRAQRAQALMPVQARLRELFERGQQIAWHRIAGISKELLNHWEALWTFVGVSGVEPTNNAAERALRKAVLWRKGCFGTRAASGSRFVERILTVSTTCGQQHQDLFPFLVRALEAHWAGQPAPILVLPS